MSFDDILNLALTELEVMFGKRNHSRITLPVEVNVKSPQVFYPNDQTIQVKITDSCTKERYRAYYQLSHEAVHMLSPVKLGYATVLEEGVAVWFSHNFMSKHTSNIWSSSGDDKYDYAWKLVEQLLAESKSGLKDIRDRFGGFSPLTEASILEVIPSLDPKIARDLSKKF